MSTTKMEQQLVQLERSFSERISRLEEQVAHLLRQVDGQPHAPETAWWKKVVGVFQDDAEFDEAMRLGRAYRESLRPEAEEATEETTYWTV
jgi:hypothetical protein